MSHDLAAARGFSRRARRFAERRRREVRLDLRQATDMRLEDRTLMSVNFPLTTSSWTAIGPAPIVNGQVPGAGPVSGRIAGIATSPTDPGTYYIAAAGGGVWKSTNAGVSWTPLTDGQASLSMGAIAVAPSNANDVFAGTGEANNSADSNYGEGILHSTDGGTTWALSQGPSNIFKTSGLTTSKIAVDPTNPNIVYAAMGNVGDNDAFTPGAGVYKSIDGGVNWANTTASIDTGDSYSDVIVDPTNHNTLYMALGAFYGASGNGVYKSTNAGASWSLLSGFGSGVNYGRISLALAPSNSQVIYAMAAGNTSNTGSGLFQVSRSDNGGASWVNVTPGVNYMTSQGWYDQWVIVSPTNPATVFVAGAAGTNSVLESTDSGAHWSDISQSSAANGNVGPHADHHAAAFTSAGKLLDGDDGGIWRLDTATVGSIKWTDINASINTIQFEGVALSPTDPALALGGSQDNGTERFSDSAGWTLTDGGDGGLVRYSRQNSNLVYRVSPIGSFGPNAYFRKSTDGGKTWTSDTSGLPSGGADQGGGDGDGEKLPIGETDPDTSTNFYPAFAIDPSNDQRLILGSSDLYITTNGANSWTNLTAGKSGWSNSNPTDSVAISTTNNGNTIYAATGGFFAGSSVIFVSTNGGTSWSTRNLPSGGGRVNEIQIDPTNDQVAYAVTSTFSANGSHVWRTTNGGSSWTNISGNLPDLPTWSIQIDTSKANTLYIGNDTGVYVTNNLGTSWSQLGSGLPDAQVFQLDLNTTYHTLAAGTHGRGMWEILTQAASVTNVTSPNADATYGVGAAITITVGFGSPVFVTGTPTLALNSGGTASYSSGSGTSTLSFTYTVAAGQSSPDLDYTSTTALTGTIKDAAGDFANETLPAPGAAGSLGANKNIVISTASQAATVTNVTSTTADGSYGVGAVITITVTFSGTVNVTGTPTLALNSGGTASYASGSGTSLLNFTYTVGAGQNSADLDYTSTTALSGTIKDTGGNAVNETLAAPGAAGSLGANKNIVIVTAAPTVTNVTSTTADGSYGVGAVITVTVTFNEAVNVTGTPTLALNSGGTASYSSGSGTSTLSFTYTVAAGQNSPDLDYTSTTALTGTIKDTTGNSPNAANETLPAPGAAGSLGANKNIVIVTAAPTVTNVTSTTADGSYGVGAAITVTVTFSGTVDVTGTPTLALNSGGTASYASGSGTNTLSFTYTVAAGQSSPDLDYTSTTALSGTIKDTVGNVANETLPAPGAAGSLGANKNIVIVTAAPTVTNVTSTAADGSYGVGAAITVTVTFNEAVNVTGTPTLALNSGGTASYASGSGTSTLSFTYTVAAGQASPDLDYTSTTALTGTIKDTTGNSPNAANETLPAPGAAGSLGANKNIVIVTAAPTVTNVTSTAADGSYGVGAAITVTVTFNPAVNVTGTPTLALNSGGTASYASGSGTNTLSFTYTVAAGQSSPDLDYTSTTALSGTIKDTTGNSPNAANETLPAPRRVPARWGRTRISSSSPRRRRSPT